MILKLIIHVLLYGLAYGQCNSNELCVFKRYCKADGIILANAGGLEDMRSVVSCGGDKVCCNKFQEQERCGFRGEDHPERNKTTARVVFDKTNKELHEADLAEFPWMILIVHKLESNILTFGRYGTGSLIHFKVVLTAAHLLKRGVKAEHLTARAGDYNLKSNQGLLKIQERDVKKFVKHNNFSKGSLHNDVALLFLVTPFQLEYHIDLICLPPMRMDFVGSECTLSGWGKSGYDENGVDQHILKKVNLTVAAHQESEDQLKAAKTFDPDWKLHKGFICAGGEENIDGCSGDGGAPLICPIPGAKEEQYYQAGIVAWGVGCGSKNVPGVYSNVAFFRDWIDTIISAEVNS